MGFVLPKTQLKVLKYEQNEIFENDQITGVAEMSRPLYRCIAHTGVVCAVATGVLSTMAQVISPWGESCLKFSSRLTATDVLTVLATTVECLNSDDAH